MSDDFTIYLDKQIQDKEFAKAWSTSEARSQVIKSIIKLKKREQPSPKRASPKSRHNAKIEHGKMNIGIDFLSRLAQAFGRKIEVRFGV